MNMLNSMIWIILAISLYFFIRYYFFPFIQFKFILLVMHLRFKRMAKRYTGEVKESLDKVAKCLKDLYDNEKLIDDD